MSQENVEWTRQCLHAWGRGDTAAVETLLEGHLPPDFEFHPLYLDQAYRGVDAVRQIIAAIAETWEGYRFETEEIVDLGEDVLVLAHITARGVGGGVPIDQRLAVLGRFEGDKLVWAKSFRSEQEALEAVGLRE
jgi:ketosteroid isomerase-like protein